MTSRWTTWWRGRFPARRRRVMQCAQVAQVLQAYLDGEIDEATARRVADHVEDCRRCGLEATVYREIKASLARRQAPPPDAVARLEAFGESLLRDGGGRSGPRENA
ncbi:zf-HC2 domain-containing protein [Streptomyces sp. YIM 98790]|uniref:anti-sigma factor family protein n=1 Tax=Streptomyces sp. YIM 98790 TaxID=2689077 RepID=UPI0028BE954E|nr:zf-HC2 domain-containing protein [Streptomyces sp. YIM 98790]